MLNKVFDNFLQNIWDENRLIESYKQGKDKSIWNFKDRLPNNLRYDWRVVPEANVEKHFPHFFCEIGGFNM
jgi:hypothetical protein